MDHLHDAFTFVICFEQLERSGQLLILSNYLCFLWGKIIIAYMFVGTIHN